MSSSHATVTSFNPSDYLLGEFEQLCGQLASMTVGALRHLTGPTDPLRLLEFRVLSAIREREPVSKSALLASLPVDEAALDAMLFRLESRELIACADHTAIATTTYGKALVEQVNVERQRWLKPALRRLNAWERSTLIGAMRFLIGSFPKEQA
ncbi:MAG TPA: hypothetical protein VJ818_04245 [Actinomycetota bacterium]|nr:hypothetical protein [Actinomycetota bacterium]